MTQQEAIAIAGPGYRFEGLAGYHRVIGMRLVNSEGVEIARWTKPDVPFTAQEIAALKEQHISKSNKPKRKKGVFESDLDWMDPTPEEAINKQTRRGPGPRRAPTGSRASAPKKHPMVAETRSRK